MNATTSTKSWRQPLRKLLILVALLLLAIGGGQSYMSYRQAYDAAIADPKVRYAGFSALASEIVEKRCHEIGMTAAKGTSIYYAIPLAIVIVSAILTGLQLRRAPDSK